MLQALQISAHLLNQKLYFGDTVGVLSGIGVGVLSGIGVGVLPSVCLLLLTTTKFLCLTYSIIITVNAITKIILIIIKTIRIISIYL